MTRDYDPVESGLYESEDFVDGYLPFRQPPAPAAAQYAQAIEEVLVSRNLSRLVDVGCGPATLLATLRPNSMPSLRSIGLLDLSRPMLAVAESNLEVWKEAGVAVESFCLDLAAFDYSGWHAALLSDVTHLLRDADALARQFCEDMVAVFVRYGTPEQIEQTTWYRYFPEALEQELLRHEREEEFVNAMTRADNYAHRTIAIDESRIVSTAEASARLAGKGYSTLHLISEEAHSRGMERFAAENSESTMLWNAPRTLEVWTPNPSAEN